jgi:hypothetical protein
MMVGEDSSSNGKSRILRFYDPPDDLVSYDMRNLSIHVPVHELARAKPTSFRLD